MMIDTHTHFYDPTRPEGVPWPPKDNDLLYRTVLPEHCKALAEPLGITGTVVVEASSWVEDNQWILDLAADEPFIVGFVGNLDPGSDDFAANLTRFAANPLFRGIRNHSSRLRNVADNGSLRPYERLIDRDLELDLHASAEFLPDVNRLAERLPALRIVVNHIAQTPIDGNAPDETWIERMKLIAERENVYCKVSALVEMTGQRPAPPDLDFYRPTLDVLWEAFGEDRLIYGSNWPVCERNGEYAAVFELVDAYFREKGDDARDKYFNRNAKTVYKWINR